MILAAGYFTGGRSTLNNMRQLQKVLGECTTFVHPIPTLTDRQKTPHLPGVAANTGLLGRL